MSILNDKQIGQKLTRLAFEIIEQNTEVRELYLAGINNNGYRFSELLKSEVEKIKECPFSVHLIRVKLNPAKPTTDPIELDTSDGALKNKTIILVDDVANTGRTLFYAFKPFMDVLAKKMQVAVLVDRKHKSFPVQVDFVGLSLATTIKQHIDVNLTRKGSFSAQIS